LVLLTLVANSPMVSKTPAVPVAKFSAGVIDTDVKFATSVGDAGGKYTAGVVDTGGKFATPSVADTSGAA
jgi:hypothetical protein